jgi:hypothetical protein
VFPHKRANDAERRKSVRGGGAFGPGTPAGYDAAPDRLAAATGAIGAAPPRPSTEVNRVVVRARRALVDDQVSVTRVVGGRRHPVRVWPVSSVEMCPSGGVNEAFRVSRA